MVNGFFDVESRGAFQGYQELRDDGAHLVVIGAHDGAPAGTDAGYGDDEGLVRPLPPRRRRTGSRTSRA